MARIEFKNDTTRALEEAEGTDGRLNVDASSDGRAYYNSRDKAQCYSFHFSHAAAIDGERSFYIQNTSTSKTLVISSIAINASAAVRVDIYKAAGTATGTVSIPVNLNFESANDAVGVFLSDADGAIGGVSDVGQAIDDLQIDANGHRDMQILDRLRLGQNDAISLEVITTATTSDVFGTCFFYYE